MRQEIDLVARFTYSPGYIDAVAVQERDPPAPRLRRAGLNSDTDFTDANEVVYYQANTLFSVYALSDGDGADVERYRYDAYGGCTVLDADGSADADGLSDVKNPYAFTGRRLDPETGLMQYRYRCHTPALGRAMSRDPLEYDGSTDHNVYSYCLSGPTRFLDPSGRMTQEECETSLKQAQDDPLVKRMMAGLREDCIPKPPRCEECSDCWQLGRFDPEKKEVIVCQSPQANLGDVTQVLVHELVHVYDRCYGLPSPFDKAPRDTDEVYRACGCREVRAYRLSGECAKGGRFNPDGQRDPKECCIGGAQGSCGVYGSSSPKYREYLKRMVREGAEACWDKKLPFEDGEHEVHAESR